MKNEAHYFETTSRFYDVVYEKNRNTIDKKFYLEEISACKGKILEIGCGTGRIFVDALNSGADIYGIDGSKNMINVLKSKLKDEDVHRVSVADVRTFTSDEKYDLVISPFRVFSHMFTVEDQLAFLKNAKRLLNDNGKLILDIFYPNPEFFVNPINDKLDFDGEYEPGKKLRRYVTSNPDIVEQITPFTIRFEWEENGKENTFEEKFGMRYFYKYEMLHLFSLCGLKVDHLYGDFERNELVTGKWEMIFVCSQL